VDGNSPRPAPWKRPEGKYTQGERLLRLYHVLQRGPLRTAEAATQLGVSIRTIERDRSALQSALELRLESALDTDGRTTWRLPVARDGVRRRRVEELQVLAVALGLRLTGFLTGRDFAEEIQPLLAALHGSLDHGASRRLRGIERKIHVVMTGQKDYRRHPAAQARVHSVVGALLRDRELDVRYRSHLGTRGERHLRVQPLALVLHRGGLYLVVDRVGDAHSDLPRRILLALDRMHDVTVHDDAHFEPPRDLDAAEFFRTAFGVLTGEAERISIRIDAVYAPFVRERFWHATQVVEALPGGGLEVTLDAVPRGEVEEWVLSMAGHAEVLAPADLREAVRARLERALALHAR
jgi:predicted DNA-binding transcriptional regulator YafY